MRYLQISPLYFLKNTCLKRPTCFFKKANTFHSVNQCLRHNLGYKQKIIQFIRRNQVYFSSSNVFD